MSQAFILIRLKYFSTHEKDKGNKTKWNVEGMQAHSKEEERAEYLEQPTSSHERVESTVSWLKVPLKILPHL